MRVTTIGGATIDVFLQLIDTDFMSITQKNMASCYFLFHSGSKIELNHVMYLTGGGATNSATSFKRLGFDASCICAVGTDEDGKMVLADLKKEGINTSSITSIPSHETGKSFILSSINKEHVIFAYRGANSYLTFDQATLETIKASDQYYITSLSNQAAQLLPVIVSHAKQNQSKVAVNPGMSQLSHQGALTLKESLAYIDILILNYSEAKTLMITLSESSNSYKEAFTCDPLNPASCPEHISDDQPYLLEKLIPHKDLFFSIKNFFKEVLKMGPQIVVITNGSNGVYVSTKEKILFHPSIKVTIENTVGAGDAFGSCFVGTLLLNHSIENALRAGIINSASVLSFRGAKQGLLTQEQLQQKISTLDPSLLKVS